MKLSSRDHSPSAIQRRLLWRVLHLAFWLGMAALSIFAGLYVRDGEVLATAIQLAGMGAMSAGYIVALRAGRPLAGLQAIAGAAWLLLAFMIVTHGGLHSASISWIIMLGPVLTLAGVRLATYMTIATVLFVAGLYVAESSAWLPAYREVPLEQRALSIALIAVVFALFTGFALRWRVRLADELAAARDAALEANRMKDRFIAYLNHEIRTPMNALVAGARLLGRQHQAEDQRSLVQAMQRSADHLLVLVNDVLDHARLEAGEMQIEAIEFSLRELTDGVVQMFGALARGKQIQLAVQLPAALHDLRIGDPMRLRQVLSNLLSNAVKFTPPNGRVTLRVAAAQRDTPAALVFEVLDSGIGISPDAQARLFQPYEQADASTARRHGGTGLGLAICKELIELMQGSIEVESHPGQGSLFRVRVSLAHAQSDPLRPPSTHGMEFAKPSADLQVLLVEDDEVNRLVMQALLRDIGVQVHAAESGEHALRLMGAMPMHLVLMDCQMAGMDGLATTRRWREQEAAAGRARVPIVALTGDAHDGARADCLAAGMDDYLTKPVSGRELSAMLVRWAPRTIRQSSPSGGG